MINYNKVTLRKPINYVGIMINNERDFFIKKEFNLNKINQRRKKLKKIQNNI